MSRFWQVLLAITLAASVLMNFIGPSKEVEHVWDLKTFFAFYGFIGCVVLIYASKFLGKHWLHRRPDYYQPYHAPEPGAAERPGTDRGKGREADHA